MCLHGSAAIGAGSTAASWTWPAGRRRDDLVHGVLTVEADVPADETVERGLGSLRT